MTPVFDTNILVDFLAGIEQAKREMARYPRACVSTITWIEVMAGARDEAEQAFLRPFLQSFERIPVDQEVAELSVVIRRDMRIKLPDAMIWASARRKQTLLITRNIRDFPAEAPDIRIPYRL